VARSLVVADPGLADAGFVGDELRRRGFVSTRLDRAEPAGWPQLDGVDLLLLLGSDGHVHEPARSAVIEAEARLAWTAHRMGVPIFAICYGAQLLSHALGGQVRRASHVEIGWHLIEPIAPVDPTDPVVASGPWMQWHGDTFTVPADGELLARSDVGPQAFRIGRSFGVQFHPEVGLDTIERWVADDGGRELGPAGIDRVELIERSRAEVEHSEARARWLVRWFCEQV